MAERPNVTVREIDGTTEIHSTIIAYYVMIATLKREEITQITVTTKKGEVSTVTPETFVGTMCSSFLASTLGIRLDFAVRILHDEIQKDQEQ